MILIDRPLNETEKLSISSLEKLDITDVNTAKNLIKIDIFNWIDHAEQYQINGKSPENFFSIGGESYWLHIRARIFFELYNDAQILDRIPDLNFLDQVTKVYCERENQAFWKRWAPQAELIISKREENNAVNVGANFLSRLKYAIYNLRSQKQLLKKRWDAIAFSPMSGTILRNGQLIDRKLEPLFESTKREILRLEYQTIPTFIPKNITTSFLSNPRKTATVSTDVLLLNFVLSHPIVAFKKVIQVRHKQKTDDSIRCSYKFLYKNKVWQSYLNQLYLSFRRSLYQFHLFRSMFATLLRNVNPDFVLATGESNNIGRIFIEESKKNGIPNFGIQHGDISPHNIDYRYSKSLSANAFPDYFFSWGNASREYLSKQSHLLKNTIFSVGQLEFDTISKSIEYDHEIGKFRRNRKKKVLFFASQQQQNQKSRIETARLLAEFCNKNGLCCVVKLHPGEDRDNLHQQMFNDEGITEDLLVLECDVYSAIVSSDYSSTCYSTIAWEAMSLKKPLIIFDPLELNLLDLKDVPSVLFVSNADVNFRAWSVKAEQHIIANSQLAEEKLGPRDGNTAKRMINKIDKIVYSKFEF